MTNPPPPPRSARPWLALFFLLTLSAALIYGRLTTGHDWGDDFASYIDQARSIVRGDVDEFIQRNAFTIHSSSWQIGPVAYPWGYPLLLAAIYPACGPDIFCLKLLNIPIYMLFLVALFLLVRRRLPTTETLLIVFLFAVNPHLLNFQDHLLSDIPFMAFSTLALWLADRAMFDEKAKTSPAQNILLGVALFAAFYVRTTGILVAAALFAGQALQIVIPWIRTQRLTLNPVTLLPYVVFAGLYALSNAVFTEATGSYLSQLNVSWESITHNLGYYRLRAFYFFESLPQFQALSWALLALAATGMLLTIRRDYVPAIYALATLAVYIVWPFTSPRFLYGMLPVMVYFVYVPVRAALQHGFKNRPRMQAAAPIIVLLTLGVYFSLGAAHIVRDNLTGGRIADDGPYTPQAAELFAFIRESTPAESTVIFFKPRALSSLTARRSLMITECAALDLGDYAALRKGFSYNQVEPEQVTTCNPNLSLTPVFENEAFIVYRITP